MVKVISLAFDTKRTKQTEKEQAGLLINRVVELYNGDWRAMLNDFQFDQQMNGSLVSLEDWLQEKLEVVVVVRSIRTI